MVILRSLKKFWEVGLVVLVGSSAAILLTGNWLGWPVIITVLVIFAAAMYFKQPTFFFYLITAYLFFGDFILGKIGLPVPGLLDEALVLGLLLLFVARLRLIHKKLQVDWLVKFMLGLLAIIIGSGLVNQVNPMLLFNFTATLYKPLILIFVIVESNFNEGQLMNLFKFIVGIASIQGLIVLQQFGRGAISGIEMHDVAVGTLGFGLQHHVGYLLLIFAVIFMCVFIRDRKAWQLLPVSLFSVAFILTNTLHALVILPVVIVLLAIALSSKSTPTARLGSLIFIPLFFLLVISLMSEQNFSNEFDTASFVQSGKYISYRTLFTELPKELSFGGVLIGCGPGMYASEVAVKNRSPLFLQYVYPIVADMPDDAKSSTLNFPWTSIIAMLAELGPFGLLVYSMLLLTIFRQLRQIYWASSTPRLWQGVALGTMGAIIFMWLMGFIMTAFEDMFITYPIFILSGLLIARSRKELLT